MGVCPPTPVLIIQEYRDDVIEVENPFFREIVITARSPTEQAGPEIFL